MMRVAIIAVLAALPALGACIGDPLPAARYVAPAAPPSWCRVAAGAYAFLWTPSTAPALVLGGCEQARLAGTPPNNRSTLTELVVEPGTAVAVTITLPDALVDARCTLDSLVLAHGERVGDLAIELRSDAGTIPVIGYDLVPSIPRVRVRDRPFVPAHLQPGHYQTLSAELARVGAEIEASATRTFESTGPGQPVAPLPPIREIVMAAVRHPIDLPVPARTFTLLLRPRELAFSIAVRSTSESLDPPLVYYESDAPPITTQLVPQAALVLSHCRAPAARALATIQR